MRRFTSWALLLVFGGAVAILSAQAPPTPAVTELTATPENAAHLRDWDNHANAMLRTGELAVRSLRTDTILPDRIHERLDQYVSGVRVFGSGVARQMRNGLTESIFGTLYSGIDVATTPALSEDEARIRFATLSGEPFSTDRPVELVILPKDDGGFVLTWRTHVSTDEGWMHTFINANVGDVVLQYDDRQTQAAVGTGTGVLGDQKKVSARAFGGRFVADDQLRPQGVMIFGEGLPVELTYGGQTYDYLAGGLDIVAHELTHGVTQHSSRLLYRNESGALNESFSDIIGTSVEFFFQPIGNALRHADYLIGEDVVRPGGIRSMANPAAYRQPDHYSHRSLSRDDNGGVHTNSGISNHAFYLAIEGGTNRTSGLRVTGVGAANREQIEKVFYHAFVYKLIPRATFHTARLATIQSARDIYGNDGAAVRAVTEAWTAVGVN